MLRRRFLAAAWTAALRAGEPVSLFDGVSLAGWRAPLPELPPEDCWRVREGWLEAIPMAEVRGRLTTDIWTVESFTAFDLSFEYRAAPAANSGVKFQVRQAIYVEQIGGQERILPAFADRRREARVIGFTRGLEYQVSDAAEPDGLRKATSRAAALYGKIAPPDDLRPLSGEWNAARIRLDSSGRLEHWLNGRLAVRTELPLPLRRTPIALQHHATQVAFRNLRVVAAF